MKKIIALILLSFLLCTTIIFPVYASFTTEINNTGLPYNDYKKYSYFVDEISRTAIDDTTTELVYLYEVNVREAATSIILSLDTFEVKASGLPSQAYTSQVFPYTLTIESYLDMPAFDITDEITYEYSSQILSGASGYNTGTWEEYKDNIKATYPEKTITEGTFMGHTALFVTEPVYRNETTAELLISEYQDIYVYFDDIIMPSGVFILGINWNCKAYGEYSAFVDYPDYNERLAEEKAQVEDKFQVARAGAIAQNSAYESVVVTAVKTAEVRTYEEDNQDGFDWSISTTAQESAGEEGVTIPTMIVVGIGGAVAAAAGIGAAGASAAGAGAGGTGAASSATGTASANAGTKTQGKNDTKKETNNKSSYKIYIKKDFGNKIRYDKPPVTIYARIGEITQDGTEVDRPDLTPNIQIFSKDSYLKVDEPVFTGGYMAALVCGESVAGEDAKTGVITFLYSGEGGRFQNNVEFIMIEEPYISFEDMKNYSSIKDVDMIFGDGQSYEVIFEVCDFMFKPEVSLVENNDSMFNITITALTVTKYKAIIVNQSIATEKQTVKPQSFYIKIKAENQDEYTENQFLIRMYPEGITVLGDYANENFIVKAFENKNEEGETTQIKATRMVIKVAVMTTGEGGKKQAKILDMKDVKTTISKLRGNTTETQTLVQKMNYNLNDDSKGDGIYFIEPQETIPEPRSPYFLELPISCEYLDSKYQKDLPVQIVGEPLNPMEDWEIEYELLKKRIKRYGISSEIAGILHQYGKTMTATQLRLLNKKIILDACDYYTKEASEYNEIADSMEKMENYLGILKWFGDQAFSYLMTVYTGPLGEAVISPGKELVVALIGEVGTQLISGESFKFENLQVAANISTAFENCLLTMVDEKDISIKKAGAVIAGFAMFNLAKHYMLDVDVQGNRDFYKAITAAFGDLTSTAAKAIGGELFGKIAKNPTVSKKMEEWGGKWLRKNLPDLAWQKPGKDILKDDLSEETAYIISKMEIAKKYITELCGVGAGKVYQVINEATESLVDSNYVITYTLYVDQDHPQNSVKVSIDVLKVLDKIFDFLYEDLFRDFPFMEGPVSKPVDPPYFTIHS